MKSKQIADIVRRLEKLEDAVFSKPKAKVNLGNNKTSDTSFTGPSGGLKLLISDKFFAKKRALAETRDELEKRGYHYSLQAVQTALSRLSKSSGPLVSFKEDGRKVYAKRK